MVKSGNVYPALEMTTQTKVISVNPASSVELGGSNSLEEPAPDYVIVYKDKHEKDCLQLFFDKLQEVYGLQINKLPSSNFNKDGVLFAVVSAPRAILAKRAEDLKIFLPMNLYVNDACSNTTSWIVKIKHYFSPNLESGFFKIPYNEKSVHYIASLAFEDGDPFSSSRIRGMLIHDIIKDVDISEELKISKPDNKDFLKDEYHGLRWLEEHGYIKDSFLLHSKIETRALGKKVLSKLSWLKSLSITSLRNYFGEKIGFSFAWRSAWLSNALGLPLFFGLITMIYGLATEEPVKPLLLYEAGNKTLGGVEESYVHAMNNPVTPYYALMMCIWVALFSKIWSRFKFIYAFKWGTLNFFLNKEREDVKFTYVSERSMPAKICIWLFSATCTFLSLLMGVIYCLGMIYAQTSLTSYVAEWIDEGLADVLVNISVSLLNTLLVTFLVNPIFERTSMKLTKWERHHFDSDFERALTKRVFFNTFFNNNIRILMMLVTPRFKLYNVFKGSTEEVVFCKAGLCTEAISYQILFFLLIRPFSGLIKYFWYTLRRILQRRCLRRAGLQGGERVDSTLAMSIERQYKLYSGQRFGEKFTTMDDMNARVAQYGFVVMFAAAFPLAPLIAFVTEVLVRRTDIDRYLKRQRRSIPRQHEGVGSWQDIVEFVNMSAICTNVWIIAFRSVYGLDLLIDWKKYFVNDYKAMQSVILMSTLVLLTSCIRAMSQHSTIPEKVKIMQRKEEQSAKDFLESKG